LYDVTPHSFPPIRTLPEVWKPEPEIISVSPPPTKASAMDKVVTNGVGLVPTSTFKVGKSKRVLFDTI